MLLVTAAGGMFLAAEGVPPFALMGYVLVAGALAAGGANAINHQMDRDIDEVMGRTRHRPVAGHRISPAKALAFGIALNVLAFAIFLIWVNLLAGVLTLTATLFYVFVYTIWLKRRTPQNIVIGGIAGSTPPLIGWVVASAQELPENLNPFDLGSPIPWMLFALIFFWTPPHFWALALYRSGEYRKVGVPMMPDVKGPERTLLESKIYCVMLFAIGAVPCFWPEYGLPLAWAFLSGGLTLWYAISVLNIDLKQDFDSDGRLPSAFDSFMRSLGYLAWMFIGFVYIVAVPISQVWYWTFGFFLLVPIVNKFMMKWKNSVKDSRTVLNAE